MEEKKYVIVHSGIGVIYSQDKFRQRKSLFKEMNACFMSFPMYFKGDALKTNSKIHLAIMLPAEFEDKFSGFQNIFSNYKLKIRTLYYFSEESRNYKYIITTKEKAKQAFYDIEIDTKNLESILARYYIALIIFMYFRMYSINETLARSDKDLKDIPYELLGVEYNNYGVRSCRGHLVCSREITNDYLFMLNDINFIDSVIDKNQIKPLYGGGDKINVEKNPSLRTTEVLRYLMEEYKKIKGDIK